MRRSPKQYWDLLARYLRPQLPKLLLLAALLITNIALQLVNPQVLRSFIDIVQSAGSAEALTRAALLYIVVVIATQLAYAPAAYLTVDVGWTAMNRLRADLTLHCLSLDLTFHKTHTPGEMIERIDNDVAVLANFFSQFVIQVLGNGVLLLGTLLLLFREDWRVGLILSAYVVVALAILLRLQGLATPHFRAAREKMAETVSFWEELLTSAEDIRANSAEPYVRLRNYRLLRAVLQTKRRATVMFRALVGTVAAVFVLGTVLAFVVGAYLFTQGELTIGAVFLILSYTGLLSENLRQITDQLGDVQRAVASIQRINEIYHARSPIADGPGTPLPARPPELAFEQVSFAYGAAPVLREVSFRLAAGESLGLVGRTGSGKTTIARLLFRFYDPSHGAIRLGDFDIRQARVDDLRRDIGLVTQDVQLFHASVRDNLTLFDRQIDNGRIIQALEAVGLRAWWERLPQGLDTPLQPGGVSAGEAQLLAFARVLLEDPGVVILDEASSRLDPATERMIERALNALLRDRTAIVIAHRLTTLQRVSKIMVLEEGRVLEEGSYDELALNPEARFAQMLKLSRENMLL